MKLSEGMSLSQRLTLLFVASSTTVLVVLGLMLGSTVERHFDRQDMETLGGTLAGVQEILLRKKNDDYQKYFPTLFDVLLQTHRDISLAVIDSKGNTVFASDKMIFPEEYIMASMRSPEIQLMLWQKNDKHYKGLSQQQLTGVAGAPPLIVALGMDVSRHQDFSRRFSRVLWVFVICAVALTGILGWIAVRRSLAPLYTIKEGVSGVTANRLDYRLPPEAFPWELRELVKSLNEMLARLEDSFHRLSDFSSDIAHELRTPINSLMTQTQVIMSKPRPVDEYKEVLYSHAEMLERLAKTIADMLFVAKADNGLITPSCEPMDLHDEVVQLCDFYGMLAEEKNVQLKIEGKAQIEGDKLMVRRAIGNLLTNAIRHAYQGSDIVIRLSCDTAAEGTQLSVENQGDGIPPEHLQRLFDRFYRVDASRHRSEDGSGLGLGLAITSSIMQAHGGSIFTTSHHGMTRFVLRFP